MRNAAQHPPSCRTCRGTGWQDGEPIWETVMGQPHRYDTLEPCRAHWTEHPPDPYYDDVAEWTVPDA